MDTKKLKFTSNLLDRYYLLLFFEFTDSWDTVLRKDLAHRAYKKKLFHPVFFLNLK